MAKFPNPDHEMTRRHQENNRRLRELLEKRAELDKKLAAERPGRRGESGADRH